MQAKSARKRGRLGARGQRRQGLGGKGGRNIPQCPPEFVPTFAIGHKFRFTSVAQTLASKPITRAMLLNLYTMATTTTNQFRLITGIKINRVTLFGQPAALGSAPSTVQVEWTGAQAPSTIHSDTAIGVRAAIVRSRPPVDSSNRWWSISGSNETETLMLISGPAGTIVDLDCSVRFADDEAAVSGEAGTGAGATVGTVYWNYLDGFASKVLAPVGGVRVLP